MQKQRVKTSMSVPEMYTVPIVLDSQKERFSKVLTLKKGGFLNS